MKMYIYSSYGVLDCEPMTLQAIETSILPEPESDKQLSQIAVGDGPADEVCCEEPGKSNDFIDYLADEQEIQE